MAVEKPFFPAMFTEVISKEKTTRVALQCCTIKSLQKVNQNFERISSKCLCEFPQIFFFQIFRDDWYSASWPVAIFVFFRFLTNCFSPILHFCTLIWEFYQKQSMVTQVKQLDTHTLTIPHTHKLRFHHCCGLMIVRITWS